MDRFEQAAGRFDSPPARDAVRHLACVDPDHVDKATIDEVLAVHGVAGTGDESRILGALGITRDGDHVDATRFAKAKADALDRFTGRFAIVNGREDEGHSARRFKEEIERKGLPHDSFWLDELSIQTGDLVLHGFPPDGRYTAILLANPEPLESDSAPVFLLKSAIIRALEGHAGRVIPTMDEDITARSKLATLLACNAACVPMPRTVVTASIHRALEVVKEMHAGGKDVVIKPVTKGGGWAVARIPRETPVARVLDILGKYKWWYGAGVVLVQEFVENPGHDTRILILDGLVLGAENRSAGLDAESWIYNISKGAVGSKAIVDPGDLSLAMAAFRSTRQFFSGIDVIRGVDGSSRVLEVNSCPGFKGFEEHVGVNVASFVVDYLALFPPARPRVL